MRIPVLTALLVVGAGCTCLIPVEEAGPDAAVTTDGGGGGGGGGMGADGGGGGAGGDAGGGGTGGGTTRDGGTVTTNPASVSFDGAVHVFGYDSVNGDLMWCPNAAGGCTWQTLDGAGGASGRVAADVGAECMSAVVWGGALHLIYRQDDTGTGAHVLRHGLYANGTWTFETIDGLGGTSHGRTSNRVGGCPSAAGYSSWLFISFYDYDARDLRIGWTNGVTWDFQPMDGSGGSDGRITADVGYWSAQVANGGVLRIFYSDATNSHLREAAWNGSATWQMATRDGEGQGTSGAITGPIAAVVHQSIPHVFYADATAGTLRHAWGMPNWSYELLDGDAVAGGRTTNTVGGGISAASTPSTLHVSYYDETAGDLRRAWRPGVSSWSYETADGDSQSGGHIDADVGRKSASVATGDRVDVFYEGLSGSVRAATFSYGDATDGGCVLPPVGVVAWWDGTRSGQTAVDIRGQFDGTVVGSVTFPPGRVGPGFGFDGTGLIEVPVSAALAPSSAMSVELWVQITQPQTIWARLVAVNEENNLPASSWTLGVSSHGGAFFCLSKNPTQTIIDGNAPFPMRWAHVAATWDGVVQRIYLDGVLQPEMAALTGPLSAPVAPLRIGKGNSTFYGLVGTVDEVTLYDRALTAAEVAAIANAGAFGKCK